MWLPYSLFPNPFLFTSREWEEKAGLYYYRARYYDPSVGRFLSTDPILRPQSCPTCPGANALSLKEAGLLVCCPLNKVCYILQGFPAYVHANGFAFLL
ncbi:MAG: RHS repeat-associated core domain-containing protein [bacterium]